MALTVEDGSGVTGANSYISVTDARAYAAARGLTLPAADGDVEVLLTKGLDYIEALRGDFQGVKVLSTQALQWPRYGVIVDGYDVESDEIPEEIPRAQAQLACDCYARTDAALMVNSEGKEVLRERVEGAVEVQYAPTTGSNPQPKFEAAEVLLAPLLNSGLFGGAFGAIRV